MNVVKGVGTGIKLLTTGEAGAMVGVSPRTIQNWAKSGKVPYLELPSGEFRIPLNGLLASLGGTFDLAAALAHLDEATSGIGEADVEASLADRRSSA